MPEIRTNIFHSKCKYFISCDTIYMVSSSSVFPLAVAKYDGRIVDTKRMITQCALLNAGFKYDPGL